MRKLSQKTFSWIIITLTLLLMSGCGDDAPEDIRPQPNTINLNGGYANPDSNLSEGGLGGYTLVASYGSLTFSSTNNSNTLAPTPPIPNYGLELYEVIGIETVEIVDTVDGGLYTVPGGQSLYIGDGVDDGLLAPGPGDTEITGLLVANGAMLTLPENNTINMVGVSSIWLANDIVINGEINTGSSTIDIDLQSTAGNLLIGSSGKITTKPAAPGQTAGSINLFGFLAFINNGIIDGSGADDGGSATSVTLKSNSALSNSGSVLAQGGDDTSSAGTGGNITITAINGSLYSSGTISAGGGNATDGIGGDGGLITFLNEGITPMFLSGTIHVNGGSAGIGDYGGDGGGLEIFAYNNDKVDIVGFDNIALSGGTGETGGLGGDVFAYTFSPDDALPAGPLSTDIGISVNGGFGSITGGDGGTFDIATDPTYFDTATFITNSGTLSANGGDSDDTGGLGGTIEFDSTGAASINSGTLNTYGGIGEISDGGDGSITVDGLSIFP